MSASVPVEVPQTAGGGSGTDHASLPPPPTASSSSKRSSNQGRNRGSLKGSSRGHQSGHVPSSDEVMQASGPRKKAPMNQKDREPKSRPSNRGHKEGAKFGGGAPRGDHSFRSKNSESGHGHQHHGNRHRSGNASLDSSNNTSSSSSNKSDSKIWSSNRFEKLELDPDQDISLESSASGENLSKSSPSTSSTSLSSSVGHSTSSVSSSSSHRVLGEERRPGKGRGGKGGGRGRGLSKYHQEPGERAVGHSAKERETGKEEKKRAPKLIKFDLPGSTDAKDQEQVERHGAFADPSKGDAPSSNGEGGSDGTSTKVSDDRITYDRETLLSLRSSSISPPPAIFRTGLDLFLHPLNSSEPTDRKESPECSDENRVHKHPTALTLIKEHDKHYVGRVSLSPQRRSFQRGCSWKDKMSTSESSDSSLKTPPPNQDEPHFKFENSKPQGRQNGPRVINHIPLWDQEQGGGGGSRRPSRKDWREGQHGGWKGTSLAKSSSDHYAEPEPEWMEFGPTDRFDVIELKGFDDQDQEEGEEDEPDSTMDEGLAESDEPTRTLNGLAPPTVAEEMPPTANHTNSPTPTPSKPSKQSEENEFILDGFDFSTGLSICKALDLDDDEGGDNKPTVGGAEVVHGSTKPKDPSELGNALLKALGVGREQESAKNNKSLPQKENLPTSRSTTADMSPMPPVNALTLEEVHARENIPVHPPPLPPSSNSQVAVERPPNAGEGMQAFNKLLAVLESKKKKQSTEEFPPQKFSSGQHLPPQNPRIRQEKPVVKQMPQGYAFQPLEKDLLDIDDDFSGPGMPHPEPHLRRLEQLERMLENMDRMDPTGNQPPPHQGYLPSSRAHPPHPPPHHLHHHHHHHQMDPHAPMHSLPMDREGRGRWMYHQERGRGGPTPQQLAAVRQQQMLAVAGQRNVAKNWAVEMEQRRLQELRQMQMAKEKDMYGGGGGASSSSGGGYGKGTASNKPNISLLPTAVMRHIHTSKPSQPTTDLPKTTSISNRLDQDLTSKASQSHSVLNSLLNQSPELTGHPPPGSDYPQPPPQHARQQMMQQHHTMRMAPPTGHAHPKPSDIPPSGPPMYSPYNVPPMAHGMPIRNPYMY